MYDIKVAIASLLLQLAEALNRQGDQVTRSQMLDVRSTFGDRKCD
jgi:hypothetical protein